jgi:hypothetical protein
MPMTDYEGSSHIMGLMVSHWFKPTRNIERDRDRDRESELKATLTMRSVIWLLENQLLADAPITQILVDYILMVCDDSSDSTLFGSDHS